MAIYKDEKRGTYYFITRIPKAGGGTKQVKRRGFRTKPEAKRAEALIIANAEEHNEENVTFEFVGNEYMEWYKKRRKASSYKKVNSIMTVNLIPAFGKKQIDKIRNRDITKFHDDLIDRYSISHAKKIHSILSATFNFAIKQEYIKVNPANIVGNIDLQEKEEINYWVLDEFKEFMQHVDDPFYYTLFMTLYYSGMRKGEMLALTWADIDFDNNTIDINKTAYNRTITTPKTQSSIRVIYMPSHVMRLLKEMKLQRNPKTGYAVFGEYNSHVPTTTLDRKFHKYVEKAGVKKIRLHDFRHSHASYLINNGAIASLVAKRLGHSDVATTLNTYSHLYPSTEKEAVLKMENDFKPAKIYKFK